MKSLQKLRIFFHSSSLVVSSQSLLARPKPVSIVFPPASYSSSSYSSAANTKTNNHSISTPALALTEEELTQINLLIPRLCSQNHLPEAIRLLDTALLTDPTPPLHSLSCSILIHRLASEPDLTQPMSLLTRLKHNPRAHSSLLPISKLLVSSYFQKRNPKHALKVFHWVTRPDSPCDPDSGLYALVVDGFCRNGMVLEGLKALRAMFWSGMVPGSDTRNRVYRGLLREARIREAQELEAAFGGGQSGDEDVKKVVVLLHDIIANWVE